MLSCNATVSPPCADPLVSVVEAAHDTAKATSVPVAATGCAPGALPDDFVGKPLTGASACAQVTHVSGLNNGTVAGPAYQLEADAVSAQSLSQSCSARPTGVVNIASLKVGGQTVVGKGGLPSTPAPNTVVDLQLAKVILNEQHMDAQGHGLTVNAVHVITNPQVGALAGADVIIAHAHSEANCEHGTTDTGALPGPNRPVVAKVDSTKHADGGEVVTYTITIDDKGCTVTRVTDVLPPFFAYVEGSASGPLGKPVVGTAPGGTQQELEWYRATGLGTGRMTETIQARIAPNATPGQYVNNVDGLSDCGQFHAEDYVAVASGPAANQGDNPGIILPRPGQGVEAATTSAAPAPAVNPAAPAIAPGNLPNTSAAFDGGLPLLPLLVLVGAWAAARLVGAARHRRGA